LSGKASDQISRCRTKRIQSLGKSDPPKETRHPDDLLLPYVEGLLNPEERASLEKHIAECAECSASAQALKETIADLRTNKDAFCPIHGNCTNLLFTASDSAESYPSILQDCPVCNEFVQKWKSEASKERLPKELWGRLKQALSQDRKTKKFGYKPGPRVS